MTQDTMILASVLEQNLPYLRRYARALTGSQQSGDRFAVATLEAITKDRSLFDATLVPRTALFAAFHRVWLQGKQLDLDGRDGSAVDSMEVRAQRRLAALTPDSREAVLLKMLEGFNIEAIATILDRSAGAAADLVETGMEEMRSSIVSRVLIIEDEPIIALDIESIVLEMGHTVVGIARTETEASEFSQSEDFDIVLADINLADGSSGIDAVRGILGDNGSLPVIFITAYPERLLTGNRKEPAFLITKPFDVEQVRSSVSQALFFATTKFLGDEDIPRAQVGDRSARSP
jgi:CheY-like chemotaxis protein/DNA-directed RNA polymerase specialized sigma24 family protein